MPDDSHPKGRRGPNCPICGRAREAAWRPFCSKRCANIDLGRWLGGRYAIPGEPTEVPAVPESDESG
ncbi:MAG: DNA gyrase inhibitor YacG [Paracoccaceae bacterium]